MSAWLEMQCFLEGFRPDKPAVFAQGRFTWLFWLLGPRIGYFSAAGSHLHRSDHCCLLFLFVLLQYCNNGFLSARSVMVSAS